MNKDNVSLQWWKHKVNLSARLRKVAVEHGADVAFYIVALIDAIAQTQGCFIKAKPIYIAVALGLEDDMELAGKVLLAIDDCPQDIIRKIKVTDAIAQDFEVLGLVAGEYIVSSYILDEGAEKMQTTSRKNKENINKRWHGKDKKQADVKQEQQADDRHENQAKPKRIAKPKQSQQELLNEKVEYLGSFGYSFDGLSAEEQAKGVDNALKQERSDLEPRIMQKRLPFPSEYARYNDYQKVKWMHNALGYKPRG